MLYRDHKDGTSSRLVRFYFVKGSITLLDVLGRYGASEAKIETTESFEKEILYFIGKTRDFNIPPLESWNNSSRVKGASFMFHSKDKINVDYLQIVFIFYNEKSKSEPSHNGKSDQNDAGHEDVHEPDSKR